jgi:phosphoribosyl-ATP pyrophosphohydrolase
MKTPYHLADIDKGEFGELSKIFEEIQELMDASEQKNPILILCELSDLVGAIEGYSSKHFNISLDDIIKMKDLNKKAFESGYRKN